MGHNTDFRYLFDLERKSNRCWHHNDLLTLEGYENPHWPENATAGNVPYRSTMVWPIRKVLREGAGESANELYIHGFLTIDSKEPDVLVYERHFDLGAGFADHLLSVLWDPEQLRLAHLYLTGGLPGLRRSWQHAVESFRIHPALGPDGSLRRRWGTFRSTLNQGATSCRTV